MAVNNNISVNIGALTFKNPVAVASGTFGFDERYYSLKSVTALGAIFPKTITLNSRAGNPPPRIHETPSGMINAIGIENPGADVFIEKKLPSLLKTGVPIIVSCSGNNDEEFVGLVTKLNATGACAIELNLSCPNLGHGTLIAQDAKATYRLVKTGKTISKKPVIAKLSPNVTDISEIALAAEEAGADAVSLVNTFAAMAIDTKTRTPVLGNVNGGLSGPAIRPVAVYMVWKVYQKVKIPIVAMGGIMSLDDALQFFIAGATMVALGTANFINPSAPIEIIEGLKGYMKKNRIKNIKELTGSLKGVRHG